MGSLIGRTSVLLNTVIFQGASLEVEAGIKCIPPKNEGLRNLPGALGGRAKSSKAGGWHIGWSGVVGEEERVLLKKRCAVGRIFSCCNLH